MQESSLSPFEAAQVLCRHGSLTEARGILYFLWDHPEHSPNEEFRVFCALLELWASESPLGLSSFLDSVTQGLGYLKNFWERRPMNEQAALYDWQGQIALHIGDHTTALDALSRAASLGRDTSLLWFQLGSLYVQNCELDIGLRYVRRSLQIFRQLDLEILSGREDVFGAFMSEHPLKSNLDAGSYLKLLLDITRLAKSKRNLRAVRELVVEMIHQFPEEDRLRKVRLLVEKSMVQTSLMHNIAPAPAKKLTSHGAII
jgi:hypothetical protein